MISPTDELASYVHPLDGTFKVEGVGEKQTTSCTNATIR